MTLSLHTRVILAAATVMLLFFGVTGVALQSVYTHDAETALQERLQTEAYALIAAAEVDDAGVLRLSYLPPDARVLSPASNLFAQIVSNDRGQLWQSSSLARRAIPFPHHLARYERRFERLIASDQQEVYAFSLGVAWEISARRADVFTVSVAIGTQDFTQRVERFAQRLWIGLGGVAILLIVVQSIILRWGLRPLLRAADEVTAIERGERNELGNDYPKELRTLTKNLNGLIRNRHSLVERHRNSLGDLAHSLKTPLAVMRGIVESGHATNASGDQLREQIDAMSRIVSYQLQKGAAAGAANLAAPVALLPLAEKLVATLAKVYADKQVNCTITIAPSLTYSADEGDLLEILGNLLDNAFKWCARTVSVTARIGEKHMLLQIDDDGPGVPDHLIDTVVQRGARADPSVSGHGIGLAVVNELVRLYSGTLQITRGALGGASLRIELPVM